MIYIVSIIAAIAGLLLGFDTGIVSGALLFIQKSFPMSTEMQEAVVSSVILGAMVGAPLGGYWADRYGRRPLMLFISLVFIVGTCIASFADSVIWILIGRLFIGFAIGSGSYTAPLYIAEIAPFHLRGALVSLNQLAITVGILASYIIDFLFTNFTGSWRWMFGIGIIPALLLGVGMYFLPESPRWLIKQLQISKGCEILKALRKTDNISDEVSAIQKSLQQKKAPLRDIFCHWMRPVLFLGIVLGFIQQATGINTIIYYAPTIFQMAGFHDASSSILATVGIGLVNVLSTIFAVFYLDTLGRRPLLLVGLVGMGISLFGLSVAFNHVAGLSMLRWVAILCTFTYIIFFAASLGVMVWLLVSEIFPLEMRGAAMGVAFFSCFFWNFIVSATFLTMLKHFGASHTFLMYAIICFSSFIFCYFKVPETKGISLEQIETNIRNKTPLRLIGIE